MSTGFHRRVWTEHDGRSRRFRNITWYVESMSGIVFSGRSLFLAMQKAEKFERAKRILKGEPDGVSFRRND